jgi:hypothetical protein
MIRQTYNKAAERRKRKAGDRPCTSAESIGSDVRLSESMPWWPDTVSMGIGFEAAALAIVWKNRQDRETRRPLECPKSRWPPLDLKLTHYRKLVSMNAAAFSTLLILSPLGAHDGLDSWRFHCCHKSLSSVTLSGRSVARFRVSPISSERL